MLKKLNPDKLYFNRLSGLDFYLLFPEFNSACCCVHRIYDCEGFKLIAEIANYIAAVLKTFFNCNSNALYRAACLIYNRNKALQSTTVGKKIIDQEYVIFRSEKFLGKDHIIYFLMSERFYFSCIHFSIQIHALCQQYGVPLFINDNVDVAVKCHAEGIHVGQSDMAAAKVRERVGEDMMIGVSAHTVQEALDAVAHGADCLGVGAAFATHTKEDVNVLPRQTLIDICNAVDVPVVAIGGIHKDNILQLRGTGVDGVALVSAIFSAKDIEAECRELKALSEQIVE